MWSSVTSDTAGKFDVEVDGKEQKTLTAPTDPGDYAAIAAEFRCKQTESALAKVPFNAIHTLIAFRAR